MLQIGADQQRLAGADYILGEAIRQFAPALGQNAPVLHFQFEADLIAFLKCDVEVAGIENLPQFGLDGAQHFILIESRTDRFPDFGEQFIFFGAAVRVVR